MGQNFQYTQGKSTELRTESSKGSGDGRRQGQQCRDCDTLEWTSIVGIKQFASRVRIK